MRAVKRLLWWILASSAGGYNRARILEELLARPRNAHELTNIIEIDYKTTRHHLRVLEKNRLITPQGSRYGKMYFPSNLLEENKQLFYDILTELLEQKKKK